MSPDPTEFPRHRIRAVAEMVAPGRGSGDSGGMDLPERVGRLETKVDGLIKDVAEIKGRISAMPSAWQLLLMNLTMLLAVVGATFAIARFFAP